ncbi:MAG: dTMP kinase [Treponema sp.]|jgi:dTMP kinase|nr:dTMP kinase [Treponema sp.]
MILVNFAVLEGCDGSGTTTQLKLLSRRAASVPGFPPFYATSEPTKGPVGELIRRLLREESPVPGGTGDSPGAAVSGKTAVSRKTEVSGKTEVSPETLARLFAADRAEHLYGSGGIVERCSARGDLVVSDRYSLSSLVYQAVDCGEELPRILNQSFPLPELLVYLDVESETAVKRIAGRPDREIFERLDFQKKVLEGYRKLLPEWERSGVRTLILDGSRPPELIAEEVWSAVTEMPVVQCAKT